MTVGVRFPQRVVSGGQTGVDRAALDAALEKGLECGGWCPRTRQAEDGVIPQRYPLTETPSSDYAQRTEWNARDSDGTLVLTWGPPTGGTEFTLVMARKHARPCLMVDFESRVDPERVRQWLRDERVRVLNVAGPRQSSVRCQDVYTCAAAFLGAVL